MFYQNLLLSKCLLQLNNIFVIERFENFNLSQYNSLILWLTIILFEFFDGDYVTGVLPSSEVSLLIALRTSPYSPSPIVSIVSYLFI